MLDTVRSVIEAIGNFLAEEKTCRPYEAPLKCRPPRGSTQLKFCTYRGTSWVTYPLTERSKVGETFAEDAAATLGLRLARSE